MTNTNKPKDLDQQYKEIIYDYKLPFLKLDLSFPAKEILSELKLINKRTTQCNNNDWLGIALHGLGSDKPRPPHEYGYVEEDQAPYDWTDSGNSCPKLKSFIINKLYAPKYCRIKANLLKPGGKIHKHFDSNLQGLGVIDHKKKYSNVDRVKYVTLAISWEKSCRFNINGQNIPFSTGDAYLINYSMQHYVEHNGYNDRYALAIAGEFDSQRYWKQMVCDSYFKYVKQ